MSKARDIASAAPAPSTVDATELGYLDGVTSAIQTQLNAKQATVSGVDDTEIGYLNGVTSAIQTQLDAKTEKSTLTTTGDIYYASAANTPARLGIGTASQVLQVNSGANAPEWATPASPAPVTANARVNTSQGTNSSTYTDLATAGPAVTLTTGTSVLVIVGAFINSGNNINGYMGYAISGATTTAASDTTAVHLRKGGSDEVNTTSSYASVVTVTAGSNTFTAKYKSAASTTSTFANRQIFVMSLN